MRRLAICSRFLTHVVTGLLTPLQVKALAICSRFQFIHVWKPLLLLAVDRLYSLSTGLGEYSESPREQCRYLFEALNAPPPVDTLPSIAPPRGTQRATPGLR